MPQAQDVEIPTPLSSGATDQPDVVQHGVSSKIEGLPEGAVLRPIKNTASQGQIEGLPEGAVLRPLTQPSTPPSPERTALTQPVPANLPKAAGSSYEMPYTAKWRAHWFHASRPA